MTGIPVKQLEDKDGNAIQPNSPDKVGFPQDTGTALLWGIDHPINQDGWVIIGSNYKSGADVKLSVNGINRLTLSFAGTIDIVLMQWFPVKKGDTVKATGGAGSQAMWFNPNRTNLKNGGGV